MAMKTIAGCLDAVAVRSPSRIALTSPFQTADKLTYEDLSKTTNALAAWLSVYGFEKKDLLVSDLPNISENLILQLACNRLGVGFATAKNLEGLAKFPKVKGVLCATESGFLAETVLPLPCLSGEFLMDLINNGGLEEYMHEELDEGDEETGHGFFNNPTAYTNKHALAHGKEAASELAMTEDDIVCVSITLCHPFGIGSAVCSALLAGATIALPAVGGIQGCGVPSERATATLDVLLSEECSLLFADTHTLKALPPPPEDRTLKLRGGVCKIGGGSTFLEETTEYGGVTLRTLGNIE
jgi:acyl-CoA synthetase (AMP-forming)/AMP-acid ligase II